MRSDECWACKDSRATCNGLRPRCSRCAKSNKPCQYGLRLSWPKDNSKKRSLRHSPQHVARTLEGSTQTSFVHATLWDIQFHHHLQVNQGLRNHKVFAFQGLIPAIPLSWLPVNLHCDERELLDHFINMTSSTLAIFETDRTKFLSLLVRLALSDNSPSSMAVLQSALALSSIHRHGLQENVFRLKARALRALVVSSDHNIKSSTVIQHIAACMILCHLEMAGIPNTVSVWFCHLREARQLIDNEGLESQQFQGEFTQLLNWVEYHMVMSRFSHRHWYKDVERIEATKNPDSVEKGTCHSKKVKMVSHYSHEILQLLGAMFDMIRQPKDTVYRTDEYEASLRCLENRINNVALQPPESTPDVTSVHTAWVSTLELFKIAALIYLKRASRNFSGSSSHIDTMVQRAYVLLDNLEIFQPAFPLLILGCEARTDERRLKLLLHIESAIQTSSARGLNGLQDILQRIWVQDDLAVDHELDYLSRLDGVISSYQIMPSFV